MRPELIKEEKPMSQKTKDRLNAVARRLIDWQLKEDLQSYLHCDERTVRDLVSTVSKRVPIISVSDKKGYKRAMTQEDLELAKQSYAELESRVRELFARMKPLANFISKFKVGGENNGDC